MDVHKQGSLEWKNKWYPETDNYGHARTHT